MAAQEATGRNVEEATEKALRALGCMRDEAHVEILEAPSKGFLGLFGVHPAKVRVMRKADMPAAAETQAPSRHKKAEIHNVPVEAVEKPAEGARDTAKAVPAADAKDAPEGVPTEASKGTKEPDTVELRADAKHSEATEEDDRPWQPPEESGAIETPYSEQRSYGVTATTPPSFRPFERSAGAMQREAEAEERRPKRRRRYDERRTGVREADERLDAPEDVPGILVVPAPEGVAEEDRTPRQRAEKFLFDIFRCMDLDITMKLQETEDGLCYYLQGQGLGILIGKHGQTLDALQYLANLAANKGQEEGRVRITLDALGYRSRREETLRRLATHLAEKACRIHAEVRLEPMNRHERKIIHMALQGSRRVSTYSDGDEPYRCVVIAPKKKRRFRPRRERDAEQAPERIEEEE